MVIGGKMVETRLVLAPMAGVTDLAFREVARGLGAGMTYTEMISAKALMYQDKKTRLLMRLGPGERPAAVQLFGSDPVCVGEAAAKAREITGCDFIDINMGCPVGKVVKAGDGSALMRAPELACRVVEAAVRGSGGPVTVKIRKGFDSGSVNAVEFARMMESAGASAVAVHGRTRAQMYSGVADRDIIRAVKEAVGIPVIANGDVFSGRDAKKMLEYTGADAVMIGRGAMGYPWIFREAGAAIEGLEIPDPPSYSERVRTAVGQFERAAGVLGERTACLEARKHFSWYLKGMPRAAFFRGRIMQLVTLEDIRGLSRDILDFLRDEERGRRI